MASMEKPIRRFRRAHAIIVGTQRWQWFDTAGRLSAHNTTVLIRWRWRPIWSVDLARKEEYGVGNSVEVFERFQFFRRQRRDNETIDDFVIALKTLANSCNFCQCLKDSLMQDKLVNGIRNESTIRNLLFMRQLDVRTCINICKSEEATMSQLQHHTKRAEHIKTTPSNHVQFPRFTTPETQNELSSLGKKLFWLRKADPFCPKVSFRFPEVNHLKRLPSHYQRFPEPWFGKRPIHQHPG